MSMKLAVAMKQIAFQQVRYDNEPENGELPSD